MTHSKFPTKSLIEICDEVDYGFTASASTEAIGPKFLRITDIVPELIDWKSVPFAEVPDRKVDKFLLRQGDIVVARTGATTGYAKYIGRVPRAVFASYLVRFRVKPDLNSRYVGYVVTSPEYKRWVSAQIGGTAQPNASAPLLGNYPVPVPRYEAQCRIADILSAYDDLIEVNTCRIAVLEEMTRGLFEDRLGRIDLSDMPGGWRIVPLGDLVAERRDAVLPSAISGDTPYVGLEHLPRRSTTLLDYGRASDVSSTKFRFQDGDILFGKIRPYFHKVAVAPFAGVASSDAIVMRPVSSAARALAICLTSSDRFIAHAVQTSNGTKMPRASWNVLQKYKLAVPPEPLLDRFAQIINANIQFCSRLAAINEKLRAERDLLLPKLISGEIDPEQAERDADRTIRRVAAA
jgi:type I restriction enzyme S subunit